MNYVLVVSQVENQFYCKKCKRTYNSLYIDNNNNMYCDKCIKLYAGDNVKVTNQNRDKCKIVTI